MIFALIIFIASSATFCTSTETQPPPVPVASYEDVLDLPNRPEILLVDVREPNELAESGRIPTSINVPRKNPRVL